MVLLREPADRISEFLKLSLKEGVLIDLAKNKKGKKPRVMIFIYSGDQVTEDYAVDVLDSIIQVGIRVVEISVRAQLRQKGSTGPLGLYGNTLILCQ